ncbi:MAG: hypothetical protein ABIP82_01985 [Nitrospirales bacterium]
MGRCRGFWPPATCQQCGKAPLLGQSLLPSDKWRCLDCLQNQIPGKDMISKSMHKTLDYAEELRAAVTEPEGSNAEGMRNQAEWSKIMSAELRKQVTARARHVPQVNGEVLPRPEEQPLYITMAVPDLAAVEASLERSRLPLITESMRWRWRSMRRLPLRLRTAWKRCWRISWPSRTKTPWNRLGEPMARVRQT